MKYLFAFFAVVSLMAFLASKSNAQANNRMYRIAKIKVDSTHLATYHSALTEQMNTAIRVETGVISYYALSDKKDPTKITIFETYADSNAYLSHIQTPHFKKYKETVKNMVLSLELEDVNLLCNAQKKE